MMVQIDISYFSNTSHLVFASKVSPSGQIDKKYLSSGQTRSMHNNTDDDEECIKRC